MIYPVKVRAILFYVTDSEICDVLHKAHLTFGYGGLYRMLEELSPKYKKATRHDIELCIKFM